jgi:hypothetical protein
MSEKKIRVGLIGADGRRLPIDCRLVASGIGAATRHSTACINLELLAP